MIEIENIRKTYVMGDNTVYALNGVSLKIEDGDFVTIMGPSGSGKSTLMHVLGLLDVPDEGSYKLNGQEISKLSEDDLSVLRRGEIGFIFQQFNLLPRMNATENVALPLIYSKLNVSEDRPAKLLEQVGMGPRAGHRPNELSGGQQQRVAIARSLINEPRMILADEPTGNLDSVSEKEIMGMLRALNEQGITVVIVTHEDEIGKQAKRLIRMRDGVVVSDTRREDFKRADHSRKAAHPLATATSPFEIFSYFKQGYKTLAANKVRTALSMLGILIGVAAVVAMLALGAGAQKAIETQLSSLGSNLLVLRSGAYSLNGVRQESGTTTRLALEDALAIKELIPAVHNTAPAVTGRAQITSQGKNWSTNVIGVTPVYAPMHAAKPEIGRMFSEEENQMRSRVAVIGMTVVREIFGDKDPVGEMVRINKVGFLVIGILPEKGSNSFRDQDDIIYIPVLTAMHRLFGRDYVDNIDIEVADAADIGMVQDKTLELMMKRKHVAASIGDDAFQIRNMADIQAALSESSKTMSVLLACIAAISLLVGGIGIMNIMLVSVTERTKEIGLRKAIGARKPDILLQFLAESVVVGVIGGLSGIFLGWLITIALAAFSGWSTTITWQSVVLSFAFSAGIGIVFGIYPARKASHLHPIDALRFE